MLNFSFENLFCSGRKVIKKENKLRNNLFMLINNMIMLTILILIILIKLNFMYALLINYLDMSIEISRLS